jgi:predicted DsbA family dithiol-disulfide isomerase
MSQALQVEVWSDVVCPWCYIGKRRLEAAVERFEHPVEVTWRSFQLDPSAPTEGGGDTATELGRKYGGGREGALAMMAQVSAVAAQDGLEYHLDRTTHANTRDAHRLLHLAHALGGAPLQGALKERLLRGYFTETLVVSDPTVLERLAVEAGLPADRVREVLSSSEYEADVETDQREAAALGATGVPFVVIDRRYGVSGAQPAELFEQALRRAWADRQPTLLTPVVSSAASGDVCGPDGC